MTLREEAANYCEGLKGIYREMEPVSGLERDYMMKLRFEWEIIEALVEACDHAGKIDQPRR